ncbi:MAG: helix-turn-helix domain-containing protein [Thiogranum sp.]|nr:helix-turn-helix domain-containing protein [Thiogranum sp.]
MFAVNCGAKVEQCWSKTVWELHRKVFPQNVLVFSSDSLLTVSGVKRECSVSQSLTPISKADLQEILGVSERTLENWVRDGTLPPPQRLGGRRVYWFKTVIEEWLREQLSPEPRCSPRRRRGRPRKQGN